MFERRAGGRAVSGGECVFPGRPAEVGLERESRATQGVKSKEDSPGVGRWAWGVRGRA